MNLCGSYRALRNNSKAAMLAAIEIYNKPQFVYRDECFIVLLVNAWELLLKATLSKSGQSIYYTKIRGQPYRTISIQDALTRSSDLFPTEIPFEPVAKNLDLLIEYRNNVIHFYNQKGFEVVFYGLAQTNIVNYRDLLLAWFRQDISDEINISLLPLAFGTQPDPIQFLQDAKSSPPKSKYIADFFDQISFITQELETKSVDTARFLTVFKVNLQSVKKIAAADIIVGVQSPNPDGKPVIIERRVDPNISHTKNQKTILAEIGDTIQNVKFTPYTFQAIVWKYEIKNKPHLCWRAINGALTMYSADVIPFIRSLSTSDIEAALAEYREQQRQRQIARKRKTR